ncbi:hypothetical protein ACOSQ2_031458 [Xanthoceras sorbifolium]
MARRKYISSSCAVLMFSVRTPSNTLHQDGHDLACHITLPHQQSLLQIITNSAASFHELEFCYSQQNLPPKCITLIIL